MWISGTAYFLDGHLLAELDTHQPLDKGISRRL
jgi:hypothetical protein